MPAPVSIVIPVLNAQDALPGCAASLMAGVEAGLIRELIVTDGGSMDATQAIAEEIGAHWVTGPASRGGQLRRGCAVAQGEWILVLHADTQLDATWVDDVSAHFLRAPAGARAGYFRLRFAGRGFGGAFVAGWANLRSRVFGLPYGDQGLLVSRALYDQVGGFPDQPLMEDVAIARALRGRLDALPSAAVTSPEKYLRQGWVRRGWRNLWTLLRYFAGVDPETLAQAYRRP